MVVTAIIAILAAILFPVFARARENARRASCQSNLKQIALGIFMYNQDYDEKLPPYLSGVSGANITASNPFGWADELQPYLKSTQIFQCPSESNGVGGTGALNGLTPDPGAAGYTDYAYNALASGQADAKFNSPASTVLLNDSFSQNASAWDTGGCGSGSGYVTGSTGPVLYECIKGGPTLAALTNGGTPYPSVRHLDGANFAFADGHVKWEKGQTESNATMGGVYSGDTTTTTSNGAPTYSLQ